MQKVVQKVMSVDTVLLLVTATAYCALNVVLNDYNAMLFGSGVNQRNLEVPLFYTAVNFSLSVCVWTPALLCIGPRTGCAPNVQKCAGFLKWESFRKHWYMLLMLSLSISISTASQNASLASIPLTINQLLKALSIVPMLFLSCLIEKKQYRPAVLVVLAAQLAGALMAAFRSGSDYSGHGDQVRGYIDVTISVLSSAIRPVLVGYLYSIGPVSETGFSPIVLAWYDAIFASCVLIPLTLLVELDNLRELYILGRSTELWGLTFAGSCMAVMYNLVVFLLVQQIASIGYQALAQFNTVVVVGGAALFIDHIHNVSVWIGTIVCLLASSGYVYLRYTEQKEEEARRDAVAKAAAAPEEGGAKQTPSEATPLNAKLLEKGGTQGESGGGGAGGCALQ